MSGKQLGSGHFAGVFLLSVATLLLELSLTRVLSVALWYHFGFLVVSTALLGFGIAGVTVSIWSGLRERLPLEQVLGLCSILFGLLTLVSFWLMQKIPFDPLNLFFEPRQWIFLPLYYLVLMAPFFASGLVLAVLFSRAAKLTGKVYAYDLIGAGFGCSVIALVMPAFGGSGSVVVAAFLGGAASIAFAYGVNRRVVAVGVAFCAACGLLAFNASHWLPIRVTATKIQPPLMPIHTEWNIFSKIDVFERPGHPDQGVPATRRIVFDNGTAATGIEDLRPNVESYLKANPNDRDYRSGIAYVGKPNAKVLILGSGAGSQVLDAVHFRASDVTAVEINPIITSYVSRPPENFWGGLFSLPNVHLVTAEGRSFVRRSKERYDAIIAVHTISNAAITAGALSLSENFVLTREAFQDYFRHLEPGGVIYFTRPEAQIPRLVATARKAMELEGLSDPARKVIVYRVPPRGGEKKALGANRWAFEAGILIKNADISRDEAAAIANILGNAENTSSDGEPVPEIVYSPFMVKPDILYTQLLSGNLKALYQSADLQIEPATDDRPFFNHNVRWGSLNFASSQRSSTENRLSQLLQVDRPIAELSLLALFAQSILVAGVALLLPLSRVSLRVPRRFLFLSYFACLGLGFIFCEMALLSEFTLYLGQPVYTYAVVLASLLIFAGIGSAFALRFANDPSKLLFRVFPVALVVLTLTVLLLPRLFAQTLGLPLALRVGLAIASLAPLGLILGMPFPSGLQLLGARSPQLVPWAWGVNAFFTVIGTAAALILAMSMGFKFVFLVAALAYLVAWLSMGACMSGASMALE